jgi:thaumarchaeosortase
MGVFSMLIYTLIMAILMMKLNAPAKRKLIYFVIGAIGTFFINIFRIFLIAYYVAFISIDVKIFHENIGEFLFLAWVVLFLLTVVKIESKLTKARSDALSSQTVTLALSEKLW